MKLFSEKEIETIYIKYIVKNKKYFERFNAIDQYLSANELEKYKRLDVPRIISIIDFKEWINKYNITKINKLLYTCEQDLELPYIEYNKSTLLKYPPHDLHNFELPEKNYDFVIFNQTLEHLYNPFLAVKNLYDHTNNNGFLYTTVPTINIPHMTPIHFWGITPIGLCLLMLSVGFEILECGYWGNKKYIEYIFNKNDWPGYEQISTNFSLPHDPVSQAQTWILVKKYEKL